jgi:hypothetical protein
VRPRYCKRTVYRFGSLCAFGIAEAGLTTFYSCFPRKRIPVSRLPGNAMEECVMTMENTNAAYGVYAEDVQVCAVVRTLNDAGFGNEDICLMLAGTHPISTVVRDASLLNSEREATTVTTTLINWLSEFGAVVIPTVGFFIRSPTFFRALVTARDAPALCGSSKTLMDLGSSEEDAERLQDQLCEHGVVVYVACSETARASWAMELLRRMGAQETAELDTGYGAWDWSRRLRRYASQPEGECRPVQ